MSEKQNNPQGHKNRLVNILVIVVLVAMAAFAFLAYTAAHIQPRYTSAANACLNNLRLIDAAANQFALEQSKTNGEAIVFPDDLTPYISSKFLTNTIHCPGGGVYHISKVGETPTCSLGSTVTPAHVLP